MPSEAEYREQARFDRAHKFEEEAREATFNFERQVEATRHWMKQANDAGAEVNRWRVAARIEHEIQRQLLERLGIAWAPGEPFVALVEAEITRLRTELHDATCIDSENCPYGE